MNAPWRIGGQLMTDDQMALIDTRAERIKSGSICSWFEAYQEAFDALKYRLESRQAAKVGNPDPDREETEP